MKKLGILHHDLVGIHGCAKDREDGTGEGTYEIEFFWIEKNGLGRKRKEKGMEKERMITAGEQEMMVREIG